MRVVVALGGNAILKRGEPMTAERQRENVRVAATAVSRLIEAGHQVIVTHGNGPQIGLMALQDLAYDKELVSPVDVLGAETEGMIGYLIEQELRKLVPPAHEVAALLTQVEVDPGDPAFSAPSKPIGPVYGREEASLLAAKHGWVMMPDGPHLRRAVPSPRPLRILEINVILLLVEHGVTVICAGGGGVPVVLREGHGYFGVEAVIDKDHASGLLALDVGADALLLLTDVDGVYLDWGTGQQRKLAKASPADLDALVFAEGSMAPKVRAATEFVSRGGMMAGIGRLDDALEILSRRQGTIVEN
jgi:carbamate kinase